MSTHLSVSIILLFGFIYSTIGQLPFPFSCPEVSIVETFNLSSYMGTWYEYSKYPFVFETGQKCQQAVYKNLENDTVSVVNTGVFVVVNRPHSAAGTAKVIAPGQLAVSFRNQTTDNANYLVLGTDYDSWAVVYSCRNITSFVHTRLLWILTRQRQPPTEAIEAAERVIKNNALPEVFLVKSIQTGCPNIPDATEASSSFTTDGDESSFDFSATSTERFMDTA